MFRVTEYPRSEKINADVGKIEVCVQNYSEVKTTTTEISQRD